MATPDSSDATSVMLKPPSPPPRTSWPMTFCMTGAMSGAASGGSPSGMKPAITGAHERQRAAL